MTSIKKEAGGLVSKGAFKISQSYEMYDILGKKLYSDPFKAIVQEYSTNAKDAHIEAGNTKPFDVHLPSIKDPTFRLRDYGTGMSPERIETICCTYGESTKRETNENTGKFGLGFKAALAYTNSYGVVSYHDGKMYRYLVKVIDKLPTLMGEDTEPIETDEPNGVSIQFGVSPKDIDAFVRAAERVYPYFEIMPNFIGETRPKIEKPTYSAEGKQPTFTWRLKPNCQKTWERKSFIIMGSNCYPLSDELENDYDEDNIDYYVEMDMFEPVPSREALYWTQEDIEQFKQMRKATVRQIISNFSAETKDMTAWQELVYFNERYRGTTISDFIRPNLKASKQSQISNAVYEIDFRFDMSFFTIFSNGCKLRSVRRADRNKQLRLYTDSEIYSHKGMNVTSVPISDVFPLEILHYDVKGIQAIVPTLSEHTVVVGGPNEEAHIEKLLELLDAEKVHYNLQKLSDVLPKATSMKATSKRSSYSSSRCIGVFYLNSSQNFVSADNIRRFKYYVPFETENTFELEKFLNASKKSNSYQINNERSLWKLSYTGFQDIINALGFPKNEHDSEVCFIRPRFVEKYEHSVKLLPDAFHKQLVKKYSNNWMGFVTLLYKKDVELPPNTMKLLEWLFDITDAWSYRYMKYPMSAEIAETLAKHRFNAYELNLLTPLRSINTSKEANKAIKDYDTLTSWMFDSTTIAEIYADWITELNEEADSMLKAHPYLFKSQERLLYNALVLNCEHFNTKGKTQYDRK
jgi:hypothetical protein